VRRNIPATRLWCGKGAHLFIKFYDSRNKESVYSIEATRQDDWPNIMNFKKEKSLWK